jgi:hypothetical protein
LRYDPASFQSPILSDIGSMMPGSVFSGELTLGLISQMRIWSAGKGFSKARFFLAAATQSERSDRLRTRPRREFGKTREDAFLRLDPIKGQSFLH